MSQAKQLIDSEYSRQLERQKAELISRRIRQGIAPENLVITVNKIEEIPQASFVQVDEFNPNAGNVFSSNPEQLRQLGYSQMPTTQQLLTLDSGRYTIDQALELLSRERTERH